MAPRTEDIDDFPTPGISAQSLHVEADAPAAWSRTFEWVPLVGTYLNIAAQTQKYYAPLEDCVDFIAADLAKGIDSPWVGKRVGVKAKEAA